jgi:uncharacterized OsmC-like protein
MKKIKYRKATCRVEIDYYVKGSFLRGDVEAGATEARTHFTVESDASPETIGHVIEMAKKGCFAENMIQQAIPLKSTIDLNGERISISGITA